MASTLKMAIAGLGAAGAAGIAVVAPPLLDSGDSKAASGEICLKSDIEFFEGVSARCYGPEEIARFGDLQVVDRDGGKVFVSLSHPTDMSAKPVEYGTCRDYRKARAEGWYALTGAAMRREAYFIRACGVLAMMNEAQPAKRSYFDKGSPAEKEMKALAPSFKFGEVSPDAASLQVEKERGHVWRIGAETMSVSISEIANADFDNDGIEEILVFVSEAPRGGSASFYEAGLIEKDAEGAALHFEPFSFTGDEGMAAG